MSAAGRGKHEGRGWQCEANPGLPAWEGVGCLPKLAARWGETA